MSNVASLLSSYHAATALWLVFELLKVGATVFEIWNRLLLQVARIRSSTQSLRGSSNSIHYITFAS